MSIPEPTFDSRRYRDILNEALARIPVHNPEWTNFNDADPGVTLLQLFAFMSESIIYRANRIPERNRRKFLRLLGVPLRAATAACGLVVFSNPRGELKPLPLNDDKELLAGKVPFRTLNGLQVLPIEAQVYYKRPLSASEQSAVEPLYRRLYASFESEQQKLAFYQTHSLSAPSAGAPLPVIDLAAGEQPADTVDGTLWLALLARPNDAPDQARKAIAKQILTLGILPAAEADGCLLPAGEDTAGSDPGLIFEVPNTEPDAAGQPLPRYRPLPARSNGNLLLRPGVVELELPAADELDFWSDQDPLEAGVGDYPPSLEETDDQDRLISWIRIRPAGSGSDSRQRQARLSWIGINAAQVVQRAQVAAERLPDGTGEPDQSAILTNTPVLADSVRLSVNGELWQLIDDLAAAAPEVLTRSMQATTDHAAASKVFTLDRESGEIRFGNAIHGTRPPPGASIQVSYAYGGGIEGVLGIGAINKGPDLPGGLKLTNPLPTYGGDRAETVAEAEQRIPGFIRHRDRLVSTQDFYDITRQTPGVELGRVEVLPLFHPQQSAQLSNGVVTVLVIPRSDPLQPQTPVPDHLFLETVCRHLAPRRLLTTEIHVRGPVYEDVWVSIGIDVVSGREQGPVRESVSQAIQGFLSPLKGGFESTGWPLGKAVEAAEISATATRVDGVAKVVGLLLGDAEGVFTIQVPLDGLQLPRLRAVAVASGEPTSLDELRGTAAPVVTDDFRVVPVPVIPEEC